jgi:Septum formation
VTSRLRLSTAALGGVLAVLVLASCGEDLPASVDPAQVDSVEAPELGACRDLTTNDIAQASDATRTVECTESHTAMTYAVGSLPEELHDVDYESEELGAFAFTTCSKKFVKLLGADESLAMRTVLTWAWFRPSVEAWGEGARWYRCDVVGGGSQTEGLIDLPAVVKGLMQRPDDEWLVCAAGPSVDESVKLPCSEAHDWRAVSTIKLGEAVDPYPGDSAAEAKTKDYCSQSVGAWLGYPVDYDYGYTWFHEAEWNAGNRRSVCWAKTSQ